MAARKIVITGATRGLGRAMAHGLAALEPGESIEAWIELEAMPV